MQFIRARGHGFCLGGACYPEAHLESEGLDAEIEHTRRKVDDGAEFLITQLFFDNAFYFHFVERARKAGITCPIVPGLMPITNIAQIERITRMCGATVPMRLQAGAREAEGRSGGGAAARRGARDAAGRRSVGTTGRPACISTRSTARARHA